MAFYPPAKQHWLILVLNSEKEFFHNQGKKGDTFESLPLPFQKNGRVLRVLPLQHHYRNVKGLLWVSSLFLKERKKRRHYSLISQTHTTPLGVKSEAYNSGWSCLPPSLSSQSFNDRVRREGKMFACTFNPLIPTNKILPWNAVAKNGGALKPLVSC